MYSTIFPGRIHLSPAAASIGPQYVVSPSPEESPVDGSTPGVDTQAPLSILLIAIER